MTAPVFVLKLIIAATIAANDQAYKGFKAPVLAAWVKIYTPRYTSREG